jgi:hypothetical protein
MNNDHPLKPVELYSIPLSRSQKTDLARSMTDSLPNSADFAAKLESTNPDPIDILLNPGYESALLSSAQPLLILYFFFILIPVFIITFMTSLNLLSFPLPSLLVRQALHSNLSSF